MTEGKSTPSVMQGPGGGEIPGGLPGNAGRGGIEATAYALAAHVRGDGTGYFVIHHGGFNLKFPFSDEQRRTLIAGFGGRDALRVAP
jgi:hypothetical protein